jgi:acyl carrier protein
MLSVQPISNAAMKTSGDMRKKIAAIINRVLRDSGKPDCETLTNGVLLDGIGLDSLDLAVVIVNLEREYGIDPFRSDSARVRTFGELVDLYEAALKKRV